MSALKGIQILILLIFNGAPWGPWGPMGPWGSRAVGAVGVGGPFEADPIGRRLECRPQKGNYTLINIQFHLG